MLAVSAVAAVAEAVAVVAAVVAAVVVMVSAVVVMAATAVALKIYYLWGDKDGYGSMFAVFVVFVVAAYSTRLSA
jgi:hypothetical protein